MELLERGLHTGLAGDAEAEGAVREVRAAYGVDEEDKDTSRRYHDTVLSVKLGQVVRWSTARYGGGCLLPDDQCTGCRCPPGEAPRHASPPAKNPMCTAFKDFENMP